MVGHRGRAQPPGWTVEAPEGLRRAPAPVFDDGRLTGEVAWVPDAPGADLLVVVCADGRVAVTDGGEVEAVRRYGTVGEISQALVPAFGIYREVSVL